MRAFAIVTFAFLLASCGGGGGGGPPVAPATDIRSLTGSQAPAETVADQSSRAAGIIARTDSLFASTWLGETNHPDLPTFRAGSSCTGTSCSFYERQAGLSASIDLDDFEFDSTGSNAILSKYGITMIDYRRDGDRSYGSTMRHSAFTSTSSRDVIQGTTVWSRIAYAVGDLTRSQPNATATWRGVMTGVPTAASGRNNFLQGDAALTYRFSAGSLDASFTNIKDITRNRNHSVSSVRFNGVPVSSSGIFQAGGVGNRIQGGFYGSGHGETVGVFEQRGIVGSFGAKKQ